MKLVMIFLVMFLLCVANVFAANEIQIRSTTGQTDLYVIIMDNNDLKIWDGNSFETSPTWTDCNIPLTEHALILGLYTATFPAAIPAGAYSVYCYKGSPAANTDTYIGGDLYSWDSALEVTLAGLNTDVDIIIADTNELQADWTNGGRLDLLLDLVLADSNGMVSDVNSLMINSDRLDALIEDSSGDRFTRKALEQGPSGRYD